MCKALTVLACSLLFITAAYSAEGQRRPPNEKFEDKQNDRHDEKRYDKRNDKEFERLKEKLSLIESKYLLLLNYDTRREALRLMDDILDMYNGPQSQEYKVVFITNTVFLTNVVQVTNTVVVVNNTQQTPVTTPAMSDPRFGDFYKTLQRTSFKDDQFAIMKNITQRNYYTINQVIKLMTLYTFDDDRLAVLEITYDHVVDKENSYQLYKLMTYSASKEKLRKITGQP